VAGQPAVGLGFLFLVTGDAKSHFEIHRTKTIHGPYIPVTLSTVQFSPSQVRLMVELHKVRNIIDLLPWDGGIGFEIFFLFDQLRVQRDNVLMTEKAFFHRRESCIPGSFHIRMAESAVDLLHARMNPVAEVNRLFRAQSLTRVDIEEIQHPRH
jgi:hypothetical protein